MVTTPALLKLALMQKLCLYACSRQVDDEKVHADTLGENYAHVYNNACAAVLH